MTPSDSSIPARSSLRPGYAPPGRDPESPPLIIGILADFCGHNRRRIPIEKRKFLDIEAGQLDTVLEHLQPRLELTLPGGLDPAHTDVAFQHTFHSLKDFRPVSLIKSNDILQALAWNDEVNALWKQLRSVVHHPAFLRLEAAWRGVGHLVSRISQSDNVRIRILDLQLSELTELESAAPSWDETILFRELFDRGLGQLSEHPYSFLIADYEFENHPSAYSVLEMLGTIGSLCHCPVYTGAAPKLLGLDSFEDLPDVQGLARRFESPAYIKWRSLRESTESRYLSMLLPRVLARGPLEPIEVRGASQPLEIEPGADTSALPHEEYCWMNAAYALGGWLIDRFQSGGDWRGIEAFSVEGIPGLPCHRLVPGVAGTEVKGPVEVELPADRIAEIADLGWAAWQQQDSSAIVSLPRAVSVHRPPSFHDPNVSRRARVAAGLPFIMSTSSVLTILMRMARDRLYVQQQSAADCAGDLQQWLTAYTGDADDRPLKKSGLEVSRIENTRDDYELKVDLLPKLANGALDQPVRCIADVPRPLSS